MAYQAPQGFIPYEGTPYFYTQRSEVNPQTGQMMRVVTYFNTQDGTFSEQSYPQSEIPQQTQYVSQNNYSNYKSQPAQNITVKKKSKMPLVITLCSVFVVLISTALVVWLTGAYKNIPIFSDDEAQAVVPFEKRENIEPTPAPESGVDTSNTFPFNIACGAGYTAALTSSGEVLLSERPEYDDQYDNAKDWTDIVQLAAGSNHLLGLKSDGTVVAVGSYTTDLAKDVEHWQDIVQISGGAYHSVALKSDGTVLAQGENVYGQCDVEDWEGIVKVMAGDFHTLGITHDGRVLATGDNFYSQCEVDTWTDIIDINGGAYHTVGLKSDGTVVATGENEDGRCNVSVWTDIVMISAGDYNTVGLKADGTVVVVGDNEYGQLEIGSEWTDLVSVDAGYAHIVGLKSDGTLVGAGLEEYGQLLIDDFYSVGYKYIPEVKLG